MADLARKFLKLTARWPIPRQRECNVCGCDPGVTAPSQRLQLYGQEDHARLYGRDIFERFISVGFVSRIARHGDLLPDLDPVRQGMNVDEPFSLFERPSKGGSHVS